MLRASILDSLKEGSKSFKEILNDVVVRQRFPLSEEDIEVLGQKHGFKHIRIHSRIYAEVDRLEKEGLVRTVRPKDSGKKRGITLVSRVY